MKYSWTILLGLAALFPATSWSADAEKKNVPGIVRSTEPVSASTMTAVTVDTDPLTADQIIDRLEASDAALKTLHCRFTQSVRIPGYGIDQSGEGELWFQKERMLRIEQKTPRPQTVVSDGQSIWIYNPQTNQVLEQNWSVFEQSQMMSRGLTQFGSYAKLRERYQVSAATESSRSGEAPAYRVTLRPKEVQEIPFQVELSLSGPDYVPRQTRMTLNDMRVETQLLDLEVNPAIDAKTFTFEPPKGAAVLQSGPRAVTE